MTRKHIIAPEWTLVYGHIALAVSQKAFIVGWSVQGPHVCLVDMLSSRLCGLPPHTHTLGERGAGQMSRPCWEHWGPCPWATYPPWSGHEATAPTSYTPGASPPLSPSLSPQGRLLSDPIRRERDGRDQDQVHDRWRAAQGNPEGGLLVLCHRARPVSTGVAPWL